jgi:hypothetical protein
VLETITSGYYRPKDVAIYPPCPQSPETGVALGQVDCEFHPAGPSLSRANAFILRTASHRARDTLRKLQLQLSVGIPPPRKPQASPITCTCFAPGSWQTPSNRTMTKSWEEHKETIIFQYKEHNKPLHEVQRFMEDRHGFKASFVLPLPSPFSRHFPIHHQAAFLPPCHISWPDYGSL